jgi:hypothetical protein
MQTILRAAVTSFDIRLADSSLLLAVRQCPPSHVTILGRRGILTQPHVRFGSKPALKKDDAGPSHVEPYIDLDVLPRDSDAFISKEVARHHRDGAVFKALSDSTGSTTRRCSCTFLSSPVLSTHTRKTSPPKIMSRSSRHAKEILRLL